MKYYVGDLNQEEAKAGSPKKNASPQGTQSSNMAIGFVVALLAVVVFLVVRQ